jgi:hypothetical protein
LSNTNKYLVVGPRWGFIPGQTGRLTVGRNIRLRLRLRLSLYRVRRVSEPRVQHGAKKTEVKTRLPGRVVRNIELKIEVLIDVL